MLSQVSICTLKAKSTLGSELIGYQTRKMGVWKVKILNLRTGFFSLHHKWLKNLFKNIFSNI